MYSKIVVDWLYLCNFLFLFLISSFILSIYLFVLTIYNNIFYLSINININNLFKQINRKIKMTRKKIESNNTKSIKSLYIKFQFNLNSYLHKAYSKNHHQQNEPILQQLLSLLFLSTLLTLLLFQDPFILTKNYHCMLNVLYVNWY